MGKKKLHYKMYKDGKKFVFAAIATLSFFVFGGISTVAVHADTTSGNLTAATVNSTSDTKSAVSSAATVASSSSAVKADEASASSSSAVKADEASASSSSAVKADTTSASSSSAAKSIKMSTLVSSKATSATTNIPSGGTVSDDITNNNDDNLLSYAANFHIFGNKATLNTHTNGNLAVGELVGNVNFGTNIHEGLVSKDLYYIGKLDSINASSFVPDQSGRTNKVVFGPGVSISIKGGQVYVDINGSEQRLDHLKDTDVYQDSDKSNYIDIQGILKKLSDNSTTLYTQNIDNELISFDGQDQNSRTINVSSLKTNDNNQIIVDIKASDLEKNTPITIKGIKKDSGSIIFNIVDDNGNPITGIVNVNSQIKLIYTDGTTRSNHETEDFSDAHILWNFGKSSAVNINAAFQGSVLAPKADIVVGQNLDGNIIGNSVTINAESHRWDFQQGSTNGGTGLNQPGNPGNGTDTGNPSSNQPGNPGNGTDTGNPSSNQPGNPSQPSNATNNGVINTSTNTGSKVNNGAVNSPELPQTGENNSQSQTMSFIGILLAMFGSLLGFLGIKKRP